MRLQSIWRYPVKAMLGEELATATVTGGGLLGDRRWRVIEEASGRAIANKRGLIDRRLHACCAELVDLDERGDGRLRVTLPDGAAVEGAAIEDALSELLERRVHLQRAEDEEAGRYGTPGAHQDFGPVALLTTAGLAHARSLAPDVVWDPRRFRPNFLVDDGEDPSDFSEDRLVGCEVTAEGGLGLYVGMPVKLCVVPTRAVHDLAPDTRILRVLAQHHRFDFGPWGRAPCLGVYAEVRRPARIAVGERLASSGTDATLAEVIAGHLPGLVAELRPELA
jgi:uncharacterized protein YcbX